MNKYYILEKHMQLLIVLLKHHDIRESGESVVLSCTGATPPRKYVSGCFAVY